MAPTRNSTGAHRISGRLAHLDPTEAEAETLKRVYVKKQKDKPPSLPPVIRYDVPPPESAYREMLVAMVADLRIGGCVVLPPDRPSGDAQLLRRRYPDWTWAAERRDDGLYIWRTA